MSDDFSHRLQIRDAVEPRFDVAGPGSRFCALCLDEAILSVAMVGAAVGALMLGIVRLPPLTELIPSSLKDVNRFRHALDGRSAAMSVLSLAVVNVAYFVLFEFLTRGRTPGKRVMNLRAVSNDGTPMTAKQVLVRNVLRLVDVLPMGYVLGGAVALYRDSGQRIGDLVAGTLVVREGNSDSLARGDLDHVAVPPSPPGLAGAEPSADELRLVQSFLSRRAELAPLARNELADKLANRLYRRYGGPWPGAEPYLERLLQGRHLEP